MFPHRKIIALTTILLAVACFVLAVMWPQWRSDIGAQGYYGYGYGSMAGPGYKSGSESGSEYRSGSGGYKCSVSITNSTVTKNVPSRIEAMLTPTDKYFIIHHVEWVFTDGKGGTENSGYQLYTTVKVADDDNPNRVMVKVYSDAATVACTDTADISVLPENNNERR